MAFMLFKFLICSVAAQAYVIDTDKNVFKDGEGRQRWWHGVNFVNKDHPFYPTITADQIDTLKLFGSAVRLGVMMPGMFPDGPILNTTYMDKVEEIINFLHSRGIDTIIDLHQDVLAPKICGEGTPDWMLNVSDLSAWPLPRPLAWNALPINSTTGHPTSCGPIGPLKSIGWSEWYMTDQCGKAFQQLYDGQGAMAKAFEAYWTAVATRFKGHPGVIAYELLNEPWVGDHVSTPSLIWQGGRAEQEVGKYMQRMHDTVKSIDPDVMVLYAPAEINNRAMRSVGYKTGFLPGAGMSYHVYCLVGTDGYGPTSVLTKDLCHFNDGFQLKTRQADLRRLRSAGFVTEFGAVSPSLTGFAEVEFVLSHFESMQPPTSWAFWDFGECCERPNQTMKDLYIKTLARPYPRAIAGVLRSMSFDSKTNAFKLEFEAWGTGESELFLPVKSRYPNGYDVKSSNNVSVAGTSYGILVKSKSEGLVSIEVTPKSASALLV